MKSTVDNKSSREFPYPKMMIREDSGGLIVLFTSSGKGTVMKAGSTTHSIGWHTGDWVSDGWKDFSGRVILENS